MTKDARDISLPQAWVILLGLFTLLLGLGNLGRTAVALHYASRLPDLPLTVSLDYLATMEGFWGVVFVVCAAGLWAFHRWARWGVLAAITLYQSHAWINHLLFDASDYARQTWPRDLLLTVILLVLFWGSLSLREVRRTFRHKARENAGKLD